ncbi:hypothetical protein BIW11_07903 [Tropilaelaps mercedesae]|uniref:Uncharacterized protein n=1 Tax=Tropilaelaps mercedesae TaxID=418985 RepID=A0A1V9XRY1_9ACAR|nr:hypothetical protein BIW11_07903 [Tropilaelaps mercedesae]
MEAERWRGQLRLLAACVAVAASVSYGSHLFFERRRRDVLKQLVDTQLRLKHELDALRVQIEQLSPPHGSICASTSLETGRAPPRRIGPRPDNAEVLRSNGPRRLTHRGHSSKPLDAGLVKSDDEEFFEFSEC